jgi:hypothetical protein
MHKIITKDRTFARLGLFKSNLKHSVFIYKFLCHFVHTLDRYLTFCVFSRIIECI